MEAASDGKDGVSGLWEIVVEYVLRLVEELEKMGWR